MQIDESSSVPATPAPSGTVGGDKMDIEEEVTLERKDDGTSEHDKMATKKAKLEKESAGYMTENLSRVLPQQLKYISFPEDGRYAPVKKVRKDPSLFQMNVILKNDLIQPTGGILLLHDRTPDQPAQLLELKSRKPATTGPGGVVGVMIAPGGASTILTRDHAGSGGAEAAIQILNAEDDDGDEDAPVPHEFEYESQDEGDD